MPAPLALPLILRYKQPAKLKKGKHAMNTKHTPGPWSASGIAIMANKHCIAICDTEAANTSDEMDENNARLIAAAPELLEALADAEFLLRKAAQLAGPMQDSFKRSAADARAAIAKATGEA